MARIRRPGSREERRLKSSDVPGGLLAFFALLDVVPYFFADFLTPLRKLIHECFMPHRDSTEVCGTADHMSGYRRGEDGGEDQSECARPSSDLRRKEQQRGSQKRRAPHTCPRRREPA